MITSGIYAIRNTSNSKMYVGQSVRIPTRLIHHFESLRKNQHFNPHLQSAYNKYGKSSFEVVILEEVVDRSNLNIREEYWISHYKSYDPSYGYNRTKGGGGALSCYVTDDTRRKISEGRKGKGPLTRPPHSSEFKRSMSIRMKNRKISDSTRSRMSESAKGKVLSSETRSRISVSLSGSNNHNFGKRLHPNTIEAMIKSNTGRKKSIAELSKLSARNKGSGNPMFGKIGELHPSYGKISMTNGLVDIYVLDSEVDYYLSCGYRKGRSCGDSISKSKSKYIYEFDNKEFLGVSKIKSYLRSLGYEKISQTAIDIICSGSESVRYPSLEGLITRRLSNEN